VDATNPPSADILLPISVRLHNRGRDATNGAIEKNDVSLGNDTDLNQEETKARKTRLHARRMRLHRGRRRRGERSVRILLSAKEIDRFVHRGYLDENSRDDDVAVRDALEWCVLDALFEPATSNAN
jgi:hypothetical protein